MINDIFTTIKLQIYERAISPLSGAFIISWSIWNTKLLLALFSSLSYYEKNEILETVSNNKLTYVSQEGLFYPLISTVIFLFIYPYPAKWIYKFWRYQQKELKEIQQKYEDETPLTNEESKVIKDKAIKDVFERDDIISKKEIQIERLTKEIDKLNEVVKSQTHQMEFDKARNPITVEAKSAESKKLNSIEVSLLQEIARWEDGIERRIIIKNAKDDNTRIQWEYYLESLEKQEYIYYSSNKIYINYKGKGYLIENNLLPK